MLFSLFWKCRIWIFLHTWSLNSNGVALGLTGKPRLLWIQWARWHSCVMTSTPKIAISLWRDHFCKLERDSGYLLTLNSVTGSNLISSMPKHWPSKQTQLPLGHADSSLWTDNTKCHLFRISAFVNFSKNVYFYISYVVAQPPGCL